MALRQISVTARGINSECVVCLDRTVSVFLSSIFLLMLNAWLHRWKFSAQKTLIAVPWKHDGFNSLDFADQPVFRTPFQLKNVQFFTVHYSHLFYIYICTLLLNGSNGFVTKGMTVSRRWEGRDRVSETERERWRDRGWVNETERRKREDEWGRQKEKESGRGETEWVRWKEREGEMERQREDE